MIPKTLTLKTQTPTKKGPNSDFIIAELATKNLQLKKKLAFAGEDFKVCGANNFYIDRI